MSINHRDMNSDNVFSEAQLAFYTIAQFATKLGVHPNTIRRSIKNGRIRAFKIGSGKKSVYRIPYSEIDRIVLFDMEEMMEKIISKRMSGE